MPNFDEKDAHILAERVAALNARRESLRVGDWVIFADGVERRISYIWADENDVPFSVQTSKGGSFYLGDGYVSFSGSLFKPVKPETLTLTGDVRKGSVWFFHHDYSTAHNGVYAEMDFRVFKCSEDAPKV